tara:strand:+ start:517 stop:1461 length:945 start_codon:yes stop_codon:yes gene_type:complete
MRKLIFMFTRACHSILPNYILLNSLVLLSKIPILDRLVFLFDPNVIRKNINFDLPDSPISLRDKRWNLLVNSRDHIGFRSYLRNEPFEMAIYKLAQRIPSSGRNLIIDIGANIGTASVPVCAKYGYELLAIEASKINLPLLASNILNNKLKAKILQYALVDELMQDYIKLFINKGNTGANSLLKEWNPSIRKNKVEYIEYVPTKTLDQIVIEEKVDIGSVLITKIDVEGMEEAVLKGSIEFLTANEAPILLEYRADVIKKYLDTDMQGVLDIFERFDYSIYALTGEGSIIDFNPRISYENIVAIKRGYKIDCLR